MDRDVRPRTCAALLTAGVLWLLTTGLPASGDTPSGSGPARVVLSINVVPRSTPALVVIEQTFMRTLEAAVPGPLAFHSEYLDLAMFNHKDTFESELVAYLAAKYARVKVDLVVATTSTALQFTLRHRARLFPGVPVVFTLARRPALAGADPKDGVSGVVGWTDWMGTLEAARRLQPELERVVVVTGASPIDAAWAVEARAQLARLEPPIAIAYLERMSLEAVLKRVAALPAGSAVLLGAFQADATGRRFVGPEVAARLGAAASVPVYGTSETHLGHGVVGGHLLALDRSARRAAEIAARMLRGERPAPVEGGMHAYRFDARQLRRWGFDAQRLPPGSTVEFDEPTLWQAYRGYLVAAVLLLALQAWTIVVLLGNRGERRRAQQELAGRLRLETLISNLLASHLTLPPSDVDAQVSRALALIGSDLDVDRVILAERDPTRRSAEVTHTWKRDDIPPMGSSIAWGAFPWIAGRLGAGETVIVSPRRPLPPEAVADRHGLRRYGTRSLLAVPLLAQDGLVGTLSCAAVRREREWPDTLVERLQLLAGVFASILARRRAEATARASEERVRRHRQELTHALRVHTLGELGASLAHEINQPLSAILINARVMSTLLERGVEHRATMHEALADIATDAKRAGDIIARLRALSRKEHTPEGGLSVDTLVDEVAGLLHQDFVRRGLVVRRTTADGLPTVSGDRIQLQQVFLNLLVNASEALDGAGQNRREITISTGAPAPRLVEVAVGDTGIGTRDLDVKQMFERFVSTKPGGIGMGLAISRSIIEAHGGRIYARANPDQGLTVYVELPADS
jgi:signal transduction histidine kinase